MQESPLTANPPVLPAAHGSPGEAAHAIPWSPAIVVPTYNNAGTVIGVLDRIDKLGLPVIVVNDGCTDATPALLESWRAAAFPGLLRQVELHPINQGKAAALHTGFAAAARAGFTHAVTIDSDGQLDPEDIPALLHVAARLRRAFVVGVRDATRPDYPAKSRLGRNLSNAFIRLETGRHVSDSQCGLRVYPLAMTRRLHCPARRFGYETQVITCALRDGWALEEVPVNCRYFPGEMRVSHVKPLREITQALFMHAGLLLQGPRLRRTHKVFSSLRKWASPSGVLRDMQSSPRKRRRVAAALATGVFIGNQPCLGFHTLLCLAVARYLRLRPIPVLAGSMISTPPLGTALIAGAIVVGHCLLHLETPAQSFHQLLAELTTVPVWQMAGQRLLDWVVGSEVLGITLALATFFLAAPLIRLFPRRALSRP